MAEYQTVKDWSDFSEDEFKAFATREGDRWTFSLPADQAQRLDDLLPDHVVTVRSDFPGPAQEVMFGKLVRKITPSH